LEKNANRDAAEAAANRAQEAAAKQAELEGKAFSLAQRAAELQQEKENLDSSSASDAAALAVAAAVTSAAASSKEAAAAAALAAEKAAEEAAAAESEANDLASLEFEKPRLALCFAGFEQHPQLNSGYWVERTDSPKGWIGLPILMQEGTGHVLMFAQGTFWILQSYDSLYLEWTPNEDPQGTLAKKAMGPFPQHRWFEKSSCQRDVPCDATCIEVDYEAIDVQREIARTSQARLEEYVQNLRRDRAEKARAQREYELQVYQQYLQQEEEERIAREEAAREKKRLLIVQKLAAQRREVAEKASTAALEKQTKLQAHRAERAAAKAAAKAARAKVKLEASEAAKKRKTIDLALADPNAVAGRINTSQASTWYYQYYKPVVPEENMLHCRVDDPSDLKVAYEVLFKEAYQYPKGMTHCTLFQVRQGDVVLDLGSNIGATITYWRNQGASFVTGYEPQSASQPMGTWKQLFLNHGDRADVKLINKAVACEGLTRKSGMRTVYIETAALEPNNILRLEGKNGKVYIVKETEPARWQVILSDDEDIPCCCVITSPDLWMYTYDPDETGRTETSRAVHAFRNGTEMTLAFGPGELRVEAGTLSKHWEGICCTYQLESAEYWTHSSTSGPDRRIRKSEGCWTFEERGITDDGWVVIASFAAGEETVPPKVAEAIVKTGRTSQERVMLSIEPVLSFEDRDNCNEGWRSTFATTSLTTVTKRTNVYNVETSSFQEALDAAPDTTYVKLDIEGAELEIFMSPIDWKNVRCFATELSTARLRKFGFGWRSLDRILKQLKADGWEYIALPSELWRLEHWRDTDNKFNGHLDTLVFGFRTMSDDDQVRILELDDLDRRRLKRWQVYDQVMLEQEENETRGIDPFTTRKNARARRPGEDEAIGS